MERYHFSAAQQLIFEKSPMSFGLYQIEGDKPVVLAISQGFCEMFGYEDFKDAYDAVSNDFFTHVHPDDLERVSEAAYRFVIGEADYEMYYRYKPANYGKYRMLHAKAKTFPTQGGATIYMGWYVDEGVYEASEAAYEAGLEHAIRKTIHEDRILRASYYDYLTGLPSMTSFFELATSGRDALLAKGESPALAFIDLSGMKFYNSTYGFAAGDALLKQFGELLNSYFGRDNCSRFGQDHFSVFANENGFEDRLQEMTDEWEHISGKDHLPVRIGIYKKSMTDENVDIGVACDRAKYACDITKGIYESRINVFSDEMLVNARNTQYIIENLDRALSENWIEVYYQPIVRSLNGRVCDEEALSRWNDPEKGMLSPGEFIPVLEDAGLIYKLDLYLVEQVIKKIKATHSAGLNIVPQSINLSRSDFDSCNIIDEICRRVDEAGLSHSLFSIEITESTAARDEGFMRKQVERFRELGFPVWMDDFGSGYSSLDLLQSIQFDLVKFDLKFMQQFDNGDKGKIVLTELIKMAEGLGIETLCEGVEREDQLEFLREVGCSRVQGFYYLKPIPLAKIFERYKTGKQIGFENPDESAYYDAIGRINLHDLAVIANTEEDSMKNYFSTIPMAILEVKGDKARFIRNNQSYRDFIKRTFNFELDGKYTDYGNVTDSNGRTFMEGVIESCRDRSRAIVEGPLPGNKISHVFVRRIAENPVKGTTAFAVAVLAIMDESFEETYASIARALASDYFNLYYVNLKTEEFIEYSSDVGVETLAVVQRGENFFDLAARLSEVQLYDPDKKAFLNSFTKERIIKALDAQGSFSLDYRLIGEDGKPFYVNMKIVRSHSDNDNIIIAIRNVDAQMNQRKTIERLHQEQMVYNRLKVLVGDIIVLYVVDPVTDSYIESDSASEFSALGIAKSGKNFFEQAIIHGEKTVCSEDFPLYKNSFTKDNIMSTIEREGLFTMKYRLVINEKPRRVVLRAGLIEESGRKRLIVGVSEDREL